MLEKVKGGLIVSCQALQDEPLHSAFIMGRMARAAEEGGAVGIRANTPEDIREIAQNTSLPIIGIFKKDYDDSPIYITPTVEEIAALMNTPCEMIALDATDRPRPGGLSLEAFMAKIRSLTRGRELMADISTVEEAVAAEKLGFDCISTTLIGYTPVSADDKVAEDDFALVKKILEAVSLPVIAEGHIDRPEKARRCLEIGVHAVVVGTAITRPKLITREFTRAIYGR